MERPTKLECLIGGRKYVLEAAESEDYIQQLARYLDKKIAETKLSKPMPGVLDVNSLFVIINIVDDLFKERDKSDKAMVKIRELADERDFYKNELTRLSEENKTELARLSEENQSLKKRLQAAANAPQTPSVPQPPVKQPPPNASPISDNLSPKPTVFKIRTETKND